MKFTISFDILEKLILRFVSKPPTWHGEVVFKYYNGKISFGEATDKIDLKATSNMYLTIDTDFQNQTEEKEMLKKFGATNIQSEDSKIKKVAEIDLLLDKKETEEKEKEKVKIEKSKENN